MVHVFNETNRVFPTWNECHWIQRIQWIMTRSKNSTVTTSITYLDIVTFPVIVIGSTFSLLPLGRYLHFIFTTSFENIAITRCGVFLLTIPILCFCMIHWMQWIQGNSFRKNSIVSEASAKDQLFFFENITPEVSLISIKVD